MSFRFDIPMIAHGVRRSVSVAGLVLATSSVGVGALSNDAGFTLVQTLLTTLLIWALPGQVIFITMVVSGAGLLATALAVTLSAVRLLPMVTSILPIIRTHETPRYVQIIIAHMTAATLWLEALRLAEEYPREQRAHFVIGLSVGLMTIILSAFTFGFLLATGLPPLFSAALIFLTPIYFLTALVMGAKARSDYASIVLGAVLGPVFTMITPELDLLFAGVIGGSLAFGVYRLERRRSP